MSVIMLSSVNQYIKTLKLETTWNLKRERGDFTARGKKLEDWFTPSATFAAGEGHRDEGQSKLQAIQMKVYNGKTLTQKEKEYLKEHAPETYEKARSLEREKRAYEQALRRCRTREEVERLRLSRLGTALSTIQSVEHNPNISTADKLDICLTEQGRTAALQRAIRRFVERGDYDRLPEESSPVRPKPGAEPAPAWPETPEPARPEQAPSTPQRGEQAGSVPLSGREPGAAPAAETGGERPAAPLPARQRRMDVRA